jgi:hypothetical protein
MNYQNAGAGFGMGFGGGGGGYQNNFGGGGGGGGYGDRGGGRGRRGENSAPLSLGMRSRQMIEEGEGVVVDVVDLAVGKVVEEEVIELLHQRAGRGG